MEPIPTYCELVTAAVEAHGQESPCLQVPTFVLFVTSTAGSLNGLVGETMTDSAVGRELLVVQSTGGSVFCFT